MKRPCLHRPINAPLASWEGSLGGPISATAQNSLLGAAFCRGELCSGNKPQPQCVLAQESQACLVLTSPVVPLGPRRLWTASGSVGTAAWLVFSGG